MPSIIADGSGQAPLSLPGLANRKPSGKGQFLTSESLIPLSNIDPTDPEKTNSSPCTLNGAAYKADKCNSLAPSTEGADGKEQNGRYYSSGARGTSNLTNGFTSKNVEVQAYSADRSGPYAVETSDNGNRSINVSNSSERDAETAIPARTDNDNTHTNLPTTEVNTKVANLATSNRSNMLLQVPPSSHRSSSPPALSSPGRTQRSTRSSTISNADAPSSSLNGRLTDRHTQDASKVPALGIVKSSTSPSHLEDTGSSTGRFSSSTLARPRASMVLTRRFTRSINSDAHLDDVAHDEDAPAIIDHKRQKRASKRKRKEEEDDDRVVVGTKVDQNHVNWVTAYNMLTGIRFTVSRTNAKLDRDLTDADFAEKNKFSFDITGNELTPSAKYDFKFKDYAPWVFRHLRATFRLDPADYLMSLTSKYILSELGSPGKSGSFFYFSRDYKYIIKTIHHGEHRFLRRVLKRYYNHVQQNPNTLLSQFYGLHRVKIPYGRKIHFVVMNNLFPPHRDIHRTFDLKGSTIGRDLKEEDLENNPRATLKDLNWLRRNMRLELGPTKRQAFLDQIEKDVRLLQELEIMDYSLLLGIHDLGKGNEENLRDKTLQVFQPGGEDAVNLDDPSSLARMLSKAENEMKAKELRQMIKSQRPIPIDQTLDRMPEELLPERRHFYFYSDDGGLRATYEDDSPGNEIYYLGVIDCLTNYNFIKRMEHFLKSLTNDETQISAIPPDKYGERFIKFIRGSTKPRATAEAGKETSLEQPNGIVDRPEVPRTSTEDVMQRARHQAELTVRKGASERDIPDVSLSAVKPSSTKPETEPILPIVERAVDALDRKSQINHERFLQSQVAGADPPTPPKDIPENERLPPKVSTEARPPTPPSDDCSKTEGMQNVFPSRNYVS